jgi:hypothetical protein
MNPTKCTKVIRLRRRKTGKKVIKCDVYIGQQMNMGGWQLSKSVFANPYKIDGKIIPNAMYATAMYWDWLHRPEQSHLLRSIPDKLKGKSLGCWCKKDPTYPCHGDVLAYIADGVMSPAMEHIIASRSRTSSSSSSSSSSTTAASSVVTTSSTTKCEKTKKDLPSPSLLSTTASGCNENERMVGMCTTFVPFADRNCSSKKQRYMFDEEHENAENASKLAKLQPNQNDELRVREATTATVSKKEVVIINNS